MTIAEIGEEMGWQAHTVRGLFAGKLRGQMRLTVHCSKHHDDASGKTVNRYMIVDPKAD